MNMFGSFFHPEEAYGRAGKAEQEGYDKSVGYQQPFYQGGIDQYNDLNQGRKDLMNPQSLQDKWVNSYEQSPYAKQMLAMNQANGMDAASSMGLSGSSAALGNIQQGAGQIVNQDRQQYLDDMMKKYMAGIGLGQDLYGKGAQAGANLGQQSMQHGENQANLQYGRYNAPGELFGRLAGNITSGGGLFGGGGGAGGGGNNFNQMPAYAANAVMGA